MHIKATLGYNPLVKENDPFAKFVGEVENLNFSLVRGYLGYVDKSERPKIFIIQKGFKNSLGIKMADRIVQQFIKNPKAFKTNSIVTQNLSKPVAENPKQNTF